MEKFITYYWNTPDLYLNIFHLKGKVLGCWCDPDELCHAHFLCHMANGGGGGEPQQQLFGMMDDGHCPPPPVAHQTPPPPPPPAPHALTALKRPPPLKHTDSTVPYGAPLKKCLFGSGQAQPSTPAPLARVALRASATTTTSTLALAPQQPPPPGVMSADVIEIEDDDDDDETVSAIGLVVDLTAETD